MLCLQETKKDSIDRTLCQAIWGSDEVKWEMQPAINSAGGILCMWTESIFKLQNKVTGNGFILLEGVCNREDMKICIVTVYSPCDINNKRLLWDYVKQLKQASQVRLWCVLGDFNCIRNPNERIGKSDRLVGDNSMQEFNEWIEDMELLEVPNVGRQYTWFRPNGESKSRLDRALISPEWRDTWPENHCPILIKANNVDWGPKPFRILNCWLTDKSFKDVVNYCWNSVQVVGWGAYQLEVELNKLEEDTLHRQMTDLEISRRKKLQEDLWVAAQAHETLLRQKSRTRWLKEGDCNTRFFHVMVNANRNRNSIKGLLIEGVWTDEPNKVKEEIRTFFSNRFHKADFQRPRIDGISFKSLDHQQNSMLVAPFQESEIQNAVWDCGNDKSPGPDGLEQKRIAWIKWDQVCMPKDKGGLGIKDIDSFNLALLAKWKWNYMQEKGEIWSRVLESKYGGWRSLYEEGRERHQSIWWKDLKQTVNSTQHGDIVHSNMRWKIVGGDKVRLWEDKWNQQQQPLAERYPRLYQISTQQNQIIRHMGQHMQSGWEWQFLWRRSLFENEIESTVNFLKDIEGIHIQQQGSDEWEWLGDQTRKYSTRSAYNLILEASKGGQHQDWCKELWRIKIPSKISVFAWRLIEDRLPTRMNLHRRQVQLQDLRCPFCREAVEEASHLFFHCVFIQPIWWESMSWLNLQTAFPLGPKQNFLQHISIQAAGLRSNRWRYWWMAVTWAIWKTRNRVLFSNAEFDANRLFDEVVFWTWTWLRHFEKHFSTHLNQWASNISQGFIM
ncbi:putative ribonuclease H protein [Glycine max]|nr:putative ribonuclease H protein [Glycine max]